MLRKHKRIRKKIYKRKPKRYFNTARVVENVTSDVVMNISTPIVNEHREPTFRSELSKQFDIKQHEDKQRVIKSPRERFEENIKMLSNVMDSIRS